MPDKRLVIIDGYSLLFRAFYGSRMLSTSDGRPTNALFGFVNMLIAIFNDQKPDAILVALDAPGKTFRHADFAEYKGTRRETPPELVFQLEFSRQLISDLQIPTLEAVGYEADDVVGTVARQAEERGYFTTIVSGDRDQLQLVDDCVSVMMPQNFGAPPKIYTPQAVREKYGFEPMQLIDYKALAGDASDNIPGVAGIGDKSATQLVQEFGSVEGIIERFAEVPEKFRKKIEPGMDSMVMSKKLATIDCNAPIEFSFEPYRITRAHLEHAKAAMLSLEFKTQVRRIEALLQRYLADGEAMDTHVDISVEGEPLTANRGKDLAHFDELRAWVGDQTYALLAESGPSQKSLYDENPDNGYLVAVGDEVRRANAESVLALFARDPGKAVAHDIKSLYKRIPQTHVSPGFDTMLAGYVLQSGRHSYELDGLLTAYLDVPEAGTDDQRAVGLLHLHRAMSERLEAESQMSVLRDVELPLVPLLAEMEGYGISVSRSLLNEFSKSLQVEIEKTQTLIHELAGEPFNIASPKQIGEVLFDKMGIPGGKKTKTGYATGAEILSELALTHPIAGEIITYRELTKLKSTYADSLPKMIADDGRIHTSFNQAVAATGRLSSNDPNLQNIPVRTELGRQIRRAFHAAEGQQLLSLDYSQIELRVLAHMCGDENLVNAFHDRVDVHTVTAALTFGIDKAEVTKEQRRLAKMLNYAVLYGVTGFGLANQLGVGFSAGDANALIKQYNERFPKIKAFTDGLIEEARFKGFTTTMIGRRRYFADINAANQGIRKYAERQAMNAPIQGTAADMIKLAMLKVRPLLGDSPLKMLLQVHDELVFEGPESALEQKEAIREAMETALPMSVPVEVDAKIGPNWLEMTPA